MAPSSFPGPTGWFPLSELEALRDSPLSALRLATERYGDLFRLPLGPFSLYVLNHPDHARHILLDQHRHYSKRTFQYTLLADIAGQGLLSSDGDLWFRQRRLAQPAFHRARLHAMGEGMLRAAEAMIVWWERTARRGEVVDIGEGLLHLSMEIVGRALFSSDLRGEVGYLVRAVVTALEHVVHRVRHPFTLPPPLPTRRNRRYRAALKTLDRAARDLIRRRRAEGERDDLLSMLLAAEDDAGGMSDRQVRDEVVTLLIAGHETVATALTWCCYLLARHPHAQEKLAEEVATLGEWPLSVEQLPGLNYARMLWQETLRLYPPTWLLSRRAEQEDEIGGYTIPRHALLLLSPYLLHRRPDIWRDPDAFNPERFREESTGRPRFAYLPFGGGPRLCIGERFATMEALLVLASISRRFRFFPLTEREVELEPLVTLRPEGGLSLRLELR